MANRDPEGRCPLDDDQLRAVIRAPDEDFLATLFAVGKVWWFDTPMFDRDAPPDRWNVVPGELLPEHADTVAKLIDRIRTIADVVLVARHKRVIQDEKYALDPVQKIQWGRKTEGRGVTALVYLTHEVGEKCLGMDGLHYPFYIDKKVLRKRTRDVSISGPAKGGRLRTKTRWDVAKH